jgi:hypothetical protein
MRSGAGWQSGSSTRGDDLDRPATLVKIVPNQLGPFKFREDAGRCGIAASMWQQSKQLVRRRARKTPQRGYCESAKNKHAVIIQRRSPCRFTGMKEWV